MKLVDNWKEAYKWLSVRSMVVAAAIQGAWAGITDDMKQGIPHGLVTGLTLGLLFLGIFGRITQKSDQEDK